ncbi:conserved hypothetical protein [Ricinus communis]|uniref:Uncharacterized protein n=1 Tax=Ricinus communis TaxID=3988 RepID=B9SG29_RICCO|nr:conserved hypothetical protein [Ricinus communis]
MRERKVLMFIICHFPPTFVSKILLQRLQNEEFIGRVINQMSLEANIYHQLVTAGNEFRYPIEDHENEMRLVGAELEDVEKQISYILRSSSSIKTLGEAESHEHILEEILNHQMLESNRGINLSPSEGGFYPTTISPSTGFVMGSSSYNPDVSPKIDPRPPWMDIAGPTGFQPFSNQAQTVPGMLQPPLSTLVHGYSFPAQYVQNNEPTMYCCMPQPQLEQFGNGAYMSQAGEYINMNLPPRMNSTTEQGTAAKAVQNQAGNAAIGCHSAFSQQTNKDSPSPF